jgi:hypothetical protein
MQFDVMNSGKSIATDAVRFVVPLRLHRRIAMAWDKHFSFRLLALLVKVEIWCFPARK